MRDVENLLNQSTDADHKAIKAKGAFNGNYIEYQNIKIYCLKNILI